MQDKLYGEWAFSNVAIPLAGADHILGAQLLCDQKGRPEWVDIQYQTADGEPFQQLRLDFLNALFLLSLLKSIQLDTGVPFPDDPRA